jgi:Glycosyltransferase family 87
MMATTEVPGSPTAPVALRGAAARLSGLRLPTELTAPTGRSVVLAWLTTRAMVLALMVTVEGAVSADVAYYARSLHGLFHGGSIRQTLPEYPVPVLVLMVPQYLAGALNDLAFTIVFALSMLAVDAAFTALLWKVCGRRWNQAVLLWLWFLPAIGPMAYFRFDLVPAALAGAAVLAAVRRPALTGALTALGAALKLWPAVMLPVFLIRRIDRRVVLASFAVTALGLALVSVAIGGVGRLLSPLRWQAARGLQIESVPATPVMLARAVHPNGIWHLRISRFKAWEIFGAGVHGLIMASTVLTVAGLVLLGVLWWRARALPAASTQTMGWLFVATAVVVTVTNKTLSPQYILWLAGPLCALMARDPGDPMIEKAARLLIVISLLTQLVYPIWYPSLTASGWFMPVVAILLAVRNLLLLRLGWLACAQVWRQTQRSAGLVAVTDPEPAR